MKYKGGGGARGVKAELKSGRERKSATLKLEGMEGAAGKEGRLKKMKGNTKAELRQEGELHLILVLALDFFSLLLQAGHCTRGQGGRWRGGVLNGRHNSEVEVRKIVGSFAGRVCEGKWRVE